MQFVQFVFDTICKLLPKVCGNKSSSTLASGNSMVPKKNFGAHYKTCKIKMWHKKTLCSFLICNH